MLQLKIGTDFKQSSIWIMNRLRLNLPSACHKNWDWIECEKRYWHIQQSKNKAATFFWAKCEENWLVLSSEFSTHWKPQWVIFQEKLEKAWQEFPYHWFVMDLKISSSRSSRTLYLKRIFFPNLFQRLQQTKHTESERGCFGLPFWGR